LTVDAGLQVLRLLCDRRDALSRAHIQGLGRAHRLFGALLPGGAPVKKSTAQYKTLPAGVRPGDQVGRTRRRLLADELAELARIEAQLKTLKAELAAAVTARGSQLMDLPGIGPAGATGFCGRSWVPSPLRHKRGFRGFAPIRGGATARDLSYGRRPPPDLNIRLKGLT
jgi:transposase